MLILKKQELAYSEHVAQSYYTFTVFFWHFLEYQSHHGYHAILHDHIIFYKIVIIRNFLTEIHF